MLQSTWNVDHLKALEVMVLTGSDFSNNRHLQPLLQGFVCFPENGTSEEKFICLWSLRPPLVMELLFPLKVQLGLNKWPASVQTTGSTTWNSFLMEIQGLSVKSPTTKNSPMLRGYDLDTREEIQPVPSQSSHSRSATPEPVTKHRCANVISLLRDSPLPSPWRKCLSLWLNQLAAAQSLAWARCQPKENNIPHWQAPGKSLAHTRVCFVCSDYLRSRHLLHRREPGTFQSRAPEPATL